MNAEIAKRLYDDESIKEVFELVRQRLHKQFENTNLTDKEGLYTVRLKFEIIRDFYSELQKILNEESMRK